MVHASVAPLTGEAAAAERIQFSWKRHLMQRNVRSLPPMYAVQRHRCMIATRRNRRIRFSKATTTLSLSTDQPRL